MIAKLVLAGLGAQAASLDEVREEVGRLVAELPGWEWGKQLADRVDVVVNGHPASIRVSGVHGIVVIVDGRATPAGEDRTVVAQALMTLARRPKK